MQERTMDLEQSDVVMATAVLIFLYIYMKLPHYCCTLSWKPIRELMFFNLQVMQVSKFILLAHLLHEDFIEQIL
jgi:hypothetical protein